MSNLAEKLIEPELALDTGEFTVEIRISSMKHDCHTAYRTTLDHLNLLQSERINFVVMPMVKELEHFIKEKLNASSEGKES